MNRKLIFFDIDGTLCKVGESVSQPTIAAVKAAQNNGHLCYLCTGRNYPVIDEEILNIGFDGVVASAGGYVKAGEQVLFNQGFDEETFRQLTEDMSKLPLLLILEGETNTYLHVPAAIGEKMAASMSQRTEEKGEKATQAAPNSEMQRMQQMIAQMSLKQLEEYDGESIYKISCMCPSDEVLKPLAEKYADRISIVYHSGVGVGGMTNNEIAPASVNKGTAVELLAEYYGVERKDTIGFGDSMNDATMLEACGMGICMANGSQDLKAISEWVCPSVEEDGVAQAMERMGLTESGAKAVDFGKAVNKMVLINKQIGKATVKGYKEIEKATVKGYKWVETNTVRGYKWVETNTVKGYKKMEKKFMERIVEKYLAEQEKESKEQDSENMKK
jgi:Cof subfamily protein (haloacid dehalogenase superfamily)